MEILFNNYEYVAKLINIKDNFKTYYAMGAFGAPANDKMKKRYKVPKAPEGSFLFDCSGFTYKAIPWGWNGDPTKVYGGAIYKKPGFEKLETNNILSICSDVAEDFTKISAGEVLYMKGHVGVYIGGGKAIECTSAGTNNVQISEVLNITKGALGLPLQRKWLRYGKLPFILYNDYYAQCCKNKRDSGECPGCKIKITL